MWTEISAKPELWRKRCDSAEAIMLARTMAWRAIDELRKTQQFVLIREPRANIVVDNLGRYAIVTARVRYQNEDNAQYAKRFYRARHKPEVTIKNPSA